MSRNILNKITERGISSEFTEKMADAPNVYLNHTKTVPSTAADEQYNWLGAVPIPREHLGAREFASFNEFAFKVVNKAYELSFIIDRDSLADDQIAETRSRISEVAEAYAHFKDRLFAALLEAATTDVAFDGVSFYDATRTIGDSATINNLATETVTDTESPEPTEILAALQLAIARMSRFEDDQGRTGFNSVAMNTMRVAAAPEHVRAFTEAMSSTQIIDSGGTSGVSNPWGQGLVEFDSLAHLSNADNAFYLQATGASRAPFYFQQREPLEVVVRNSTEEVAENDGVKVLLRERFRFAYGDPRRSFRTLLSV